MNWSGLVSRGEEHLRDHSFAVFFFQSDGKDHDLVERRPSRTLT